MIKSIKLFLVPDQIIEDDNLLDERYNSLVDMHLLVIDLTEDEVIDLEILTYPKEKRTRQWVDEKFYHLQELDVELTHGELEEDVPSETNNVSIIGSSREAPKSPPITRSKKRKTHPNKNLKLRST